MHYYLIVGLQVYCAYHAYKNRSQTYWYFIIFLAPLIGSLVYLITQVFTKRDIDKVQTEITSVINPTKKVKDLELAVSFADTFQNRMNVADAYLEIHDYDNAISHYINGLIGIHDTDLYGNNQLIKAYYEQNAFEDVIAIGEKLIENRLFQKEEAYFLYGVALSKSNRIEEAEKVLRAFDKRYSNYQKRLDLCRFLVKINKKEDAILILSELKNEGETITKNNKRVYRKLFAEVDVLFQELQS